MKSSSLQFWLTDWCNNTKLSSCSLSAQGAWMRVLRVLHESDECGVWRLPFTALARAAGVPIRILRELSTNYVLKGADEKATPYVHVPRHAGKTHAPVILVRPDNGPCWYSTRLVRDEWRRQQRGLKTRFTSSNQPPSRPPTGRVGERLGDGALKSLKKEQELRAEQEHRSRALHQEKAYLCNGNVGGVQ